MKSIFYCYLDGKVHQKNMTLSEAKEFAWSNTYEKALRAGLALVNKQIRDLKSEAKLIQTTLEEE